MKLGRDGRRLLVSGTGKILSVFMLLCFVTLFTNSLSADVVSTNFGLYGAQAHSFSVYNDGTTRIVYATVMGPNKVFKSTDNGAAWSVILSSSDPYQGEAQDSVVDESNGYLYVCLNDGVLRTTDAGANWSLVFDSSLYNYEGVNCLTILGSTLYIGTSAGSVYRSNDYGGSWTKIGSLGDYRVESISVHPSAVDIIFAVCEVEGGSDLHRTGDGGNTWGEVVIPDFTDFQVVGIDDSASGTTLDATTLYVAGSSANPAVYKSADGGANWEKKDQFNSGCPQYIVFDNGDLFISASKSSDGGDTWEHFPLSGGDTETHINDGALAIDPVDSNLLFATSDRGIAKSTDGGVNWVESYQGLEALVINDAVLSSDKNIFFFVSKSGAGKTSDFSGSQTWSFPIYPQNLIEGQPPAETGGQEPLMSVAIEPNYDGVDYNTVYIGGNAGEIFTSDNGGESWIMKEIYPAGSHVNVTKIAVSSDFPDVVYASLLNWERDENDGKVVKSIDKGVTWEGTALAGVPANTVLFFQGTEEEIIVLAGLGTEEAAAEENSTMLGLRKSTDGGDTWSGINDLAETVVYCLTVDPTDKNIIYAGGGDFVYKSTDQGNTWDDIFEISGGHRCRAIVVNPDNPAEVYAAADNYIYWSTDSGATWDLFYEGLDQDNIHVLIYGSLLGGSETGLYRYSSTTEAVTGGEGDERCFIATAAYGTPLAEEVETLRKFRDNVLMKTTAGREFVELYYKTSPPIANLIRSKPLLRALVRKGLEPLIWFSRLTTDL